MKKHCHIDRYCNNPGFLRNPTEDKRAFRRMLTSADHLKSGYCNCRRKLEAFV